MAQKGHSAPQHAPQVDKVVPEAIAELLSTPGDATFGDASTVPDPHGASGEAMTFSSADVHDQVVLSLHDLLPDSNGDVVLVNDAGPLAVNITTDAPIMETGTSDHYVTSAGVDVSGYHFCTFEAGVTIYYPPGIDLLVTAS